MGDQEAVRQAERRTGPQRGDDPVVVLHLRGIGDQQQDHVGAGDHLVHLAERAVRRGEARGFGLRPRARAGPEPHRHLDAAALQRLAQILCLRRRLRGPADDPDLPDALQGVRQARKEMAPTPNDPFLGIAQFDPFLREYRRRERHRFPQSG